MSRRSSRFTSTTATPRQTSTRRSMPVWSAPRNTPGTSARLTTFVRERRLGARYAVPRTRPPRERGCRNGAEIAYNRPRPPPIFGGCARSRNRVVGNVCCAATRHHPTTWIASVASRRHRQTSLEPTSYPSAAPSPNRRSLRPSKPLPGRSRGASAFGFRRRGQRRPPSSFSARRSTGRATRYNPGGPDLEPRACIHPREYLCAAATYRGSAVAPKRPKTSRSSAQGAFYPGSRIRTSENLPSKHSGEYKGRSAGALQTTRPLADRSTAGP